MLSCIALYLHGQWNPGLVFYSSKLFNLQLLLLWHAYTCESKKFKKEKITKYYYQKPLYLHKHKTICPKLIKKNTKNVRDKDIYQDFTFEDGVSAAHNFMNKRFAEVVHPCMTAFMHQCFLSWNFTHAGRNLVHSEIGFSGFVSRSSISL